MPSTTDTDADIAAWRAERRQQVAGYVPSRWLRPVRLAGGAFDGREVLVDCPVAFVVGDEEGRPIALMTPPERDTAAWRDRTAACYSPGAEPDVFVWRPRPAAS